MGGFESVPADCIILLFAGWTLDNRIKFAFGAIGTFFLAVLCEVLTWVRRSYLSDSSSVRLFRGRRRLLKALKATLFTTQVTLGYFLMLVAMTYQVELFIMVVLGLGAGHTLFNLTAPVGESTDACCVEDAKATAQHGGRVAPAPSPESNGSATVVPDCCRHK